MGGGLMADDGDEADGAGGGDGAHLEWLVNEM